MVRKKGTTKVQLRELALSEVGILAALTYVCKCKSDHGAQSCPERIGIQAEILRAIRADVFAQNVGDGSRLRFISKDLRSAMTKTRPSIPVRLYAAQRASIFHYKVAGAYVCESTYIELMCISAHTLQNARKLAFNTHINLR